jgi:hypothetical protein
MKPWSELLQTDFRNSLYTYYVHKSVKQDWIIKQHISW